MDVRRSESNHGEHALIVGRFPFQSYVRFVRWKGVNGYRADEQSLAQEWREIQRHAVEVDASESGVADDPQFIPLPDDMIPIADTARKTEAAQRAMGPRVCQWWLVEIDRAVVFQSWVDLNFARNIQAQAPRPVTHVDHVRIATGDYLVKPEVNASRVSDERFVFVSPSTDVRFIGSALLDPSCLQNYQPAGRASHVVAVFFGSSVNTLSAMHVRNRLILVNGTHRAFALRALGFSHIACLVTHIRTDEEEKRLLPPAIAQDAALYLTAKRPPMFKDYFDPAVCRTVETVQLNTLLKLRLKHSMESIPAL